MKTTTTYEIGLPTRIAQKVSSWTGATFKQSAHPQDAYLTTNDYNTFQSIKFKLSKYYDLRISKCADNVQVSGVESYYA